MSTDIPIEMMHGGASFTQELPDWVRFAIADAVVRFGRLEQEIIEIAWLIKGANEKEQRAKVARKPATDNFDDVLRLVEAAASSALAGLRSTFDDLAKDRNLITHGAWWMVDGHKPWVVWHKFIEDSDSVMGEYYMESRFSDL